MALNANKLPSKNNFTTMEPGTYPARLVGVVALGLQAQREFKGEPKPPAQEIALTYEFVDEFMQDEDGNPDPKKPRWITEILPFYPLSSDKAKCTQRYNVFDPEHKDDGDWVQQINKPVNATVVLNPSKGRVYENISGLSAMRAKDADKTPELVNKPLIFDTETPDMEVWARIPKFLKDKIVAGLEYEGSELQKLVGKDSTPAKTETKAKPKAAPKKVADDEADAPPY